MNLKVWGPLLFASMLFVIAAVIKFVSFTKAAAFLSMGSEFALWATGVLFSLAASEQTRFGGRTEHIFRRKTSGSSIEIQYKALAPDRIDLSPRFLYFFVYSMMIWILCIVISEKSCAIYALQNQYSIKLILLCALCFVLSATSVGIAIRSLLEVS